MHTRRKEVMFVFILSFAMSAFLAVITISRPNVLFIGLLIAFLAATCFGGYRVFACSDAWHEAREQKERLWMARHPNLMTLIVILSAVAFFWEVISDLLRWLSQ